MSNWAVAYVFRSIPDLFSVVTCCDKLFQLRLEALVDLHRVPALTDDRRICFIDVQHACTMQLGRSADDMQGSR